MLLIISKDNTSHNIIAMFRSAAATFHNIGFHDQVFKNIGDYKITCTTDPIEGNRLTLDSLKLTVTPGSFRSIFFGNLLLIPTQMNPTLSK